MRVPERGYALLLAIVVVAALSLAALAAARAQGDAGVSIARLEGANEEAIVAETAMSRAAFLLLTGERTPRSVLAGARASGAAEVRLDGRLYALPGAEGVYLSVQDEAGLFNLNAPDAQTLAALLRLAGAPDSEALAARLLDYVDEDDLVRAGGAEDDAYARSSLSGPLNAPLISRWQALDALGWREDVPARADIWAWLTTLNGEAALNINTAPPEVLVALAGDRRRAQTILERREASPLADLSEVEALFANARADRITLTVEPASVFRVQAVFSSQQGEHAIERRIELSPEGEQRPFRWIEERRGRLIQRDHGGTIDDLPLGPPSP